MAAGWAVEALVHATRSPYLAIFVVGAFGLVYFATAAALGVPEARRIVGTLTRTGGRA